MKRVLIHVYQCGACARVFLTESEHDEDNCRKTREDDAALIAASQRKREAKILRARQAAMNDKALGILILEKCIQAARGRAEQLLNHADIDFNSSIETESCIDQMIQAATEHMQGR